MSGLYLSDVFWFWSDHSKRSDFDLMQLLETDRQALVRKVEKVEL